jgi:hypothetical protein
MNMLSQSKCNECSTTAVSQRLLERTMTFAEIAELSDKCNHLWKLDRPGAKQKNDRLTFVVPAFQQLVSMSRFVE